MNSRDLVSAERLLPAPLALLWGLSALLAITGASSGCAPGCASSPASSIPASSRIDGARALTDLEKLVAIGQRQSATPGAEAARLYMEQQLSAAGLTPVREKFTQATPIGDIEFVNLFAELAPKEGLKEQGWILFCAHYDTKRMSFPFLGANDSGSGTALLLELARCMAALPRGPFGYRFVFLDGEEAINLVWQDPDNRYGSRYHAKRLRETGRANKFKACVLFDMIGDRDLHVMQEGYSDPKLFEVFAKSANELGHSQHFATRRGQEILDDHLSFMEVGIRAVDLIDFDYGPNNSWWHTKEDVLANCSQSSLEIVGNVVLNALPALQQHLTR